MRHLIWFYPYRFTFRAEGMDLSQLVRALVALPDSTDIESRTSENRIRLWVKLPLFFHNSWNPIFDGHLSRTSELSELRGFFRPSWFVLVFTLLFLGGSLLQLIGALQAPEVRAGYVLGWKENEVHFNLVFLVGAVLISTAGWAAGLFAQFKLLRMLQTVASRT